jgi:dTDP-4-dehydrorhamnose 3,5-epimerase
MSAASSPELGASRVREAGACCTNGASQRVLQQEKKGTLRGMHYQAYPSEEVRLVRCSRGATFSTVVDLRPHSPTFLRHLSLTLTAENHAALYVPPGCALGFQTLEDQTEVFYQMSTLYVPAYARGFRWDDPAFGLQWPDDDRIILDRDRTYPDFEERLVADLRHHPL